MSANRQVGGSQRGASNPTMPWRERMERLEQELDAAREEAALSRAMIQRSSDRLDRLCRMLHTHMAVLAAGIDEPAAPDFDTRVDEVCASAADQEEPIGG